MTMLTSTNELKHWKELPRSTQLLLMGISEFDYYWHLSI